MESLRLVAATLEIDLEKGTVVELHPRQNRKALQQKYRWQPGPSEINRVIVDIWPKKEGDRLEVITGISKPKPPLSHGADRAVRVAGSVLWKLSNAIEDLKEPSLKGFANEIRRRAKGSYFQNVYEALGEMAEHRMQVLKQRRTKKGIWCATLEWFGRFRRVTAK